MQQKKQARVRRKDRRQVAKAQQGGLVEPSGKVAGRGSSKGDKGSKPDDKVELSILDASFGDTKTFTVGYLPTDLKSLQEAYSEPLDYRDPQHRCPNTIEDKILKCFRRAIHGGQVRVSTAFAAQLFLDIGKVMETHPSMPLAEIDEMAERYLAQEGRGNKLYLESFKKQHNDNSGMQAFVRAILSGNKSPDGARYETQPTLRGLLAKHPLLCRVLKMFIRITRAIVMLQLTDARGGILSCLHFYNAVKQNGLLKAEWHEMEHLIRTHGANKVFLCDVPTTWEECLNSYRVVWCHGFDLGEIYEGRGRLPKGERRGKMHEKLVPLTMLICGRVRYRSEDSTMLSVSNSELNIRGFESCGYDMVQQNADGNLLNRYDLAKIAEGQPRPSTIQHLRNVEKHLVLEFPRLDFDYEAIEQRCWHFFRATKRALDLAGMRIRFHGFDGDKLLTWQLHEELSMRKLLSYARTNDSIAIKEMKQGEALTLELSLSNRKRLEIVV